jgi:short-subunit dehydrogenase
MFTELADSLRNPLPNVTPTPLEDIDIAYGTVVIVGVDQGIGFEIARQLLCLRAGTMIVTASRLMDLQDVLLKLRDDPEVNAKNPGAIIDVRAVDLNDHESVIIFGNYVERQYTSIDIVILIDCCSQPSTKPGSTTRMKYSPSIFQIVSCRSSSSLALRQLSW